MNVSNSGILYIVSTPIGNLEDFTFRAKNVLSQVDMILAEDTRRTSKLLAHFELKTPSTSYHDYSTGKKLDFVIRSLLEGKHFAIVSDSGTPLLSDPGFPLVRMAIENEIQVIPVPGASALLSAIVASGAPMDSFAFEGFLPAKGSGRNQRINRIIQEERTVVLYESPYHIKKLLQTLKEQLGSDRPIMIARELTKIHEEFLRGTIDEVIERFKKTVPKGEFVVIIPKKVKEKNAKRVSR